MQSCTLLPYYTQRSGDGCEEGGRKNGMVHEEPSHSLYRIYNLWRARPATTNCAQNGNQDTRADEGDDDAPPEPEVRVGGQEIGEQPTNESANDTDDDVSNDAITATAHDNTSQKTGDQPNNNPCQ